MNIHTHVWVNLCLDHLIFLDDQLNQLFEYYDNVILSGQNTGLIEKHKEVWTNYCRY